MKMKEIVTRATDHLDHELVEAKKHLFDLRSQAVTEKLEDPTPASEDQAGYRPD